MEARLDSSRSARSAVSIREILAAILSVRGAATATSRSGPIRDKINVFYDGTDGVIRKS
jgi:hypothetical protein